MALTEYPTLSYLEHSRSPTPSILLTTYLSISVLLGAAQTRTLWLASTTRIERELTEAFTAALAKSRWVRWDVKQHSPEETRRLFNLGAVLWLNRLFLTAYRKTLTLDNLYPLDLRMVSEPLQASLWRHATHMSRLRQKYGLAIALGRSMPIPLLLPPFLVSLLLDYLQDVQDVSSRNIGYGLIAATILVYVGLAFSGGLYWYLQERKAVEEKLSATTHSGALTLMSADIKRVIFGDINLHEVWANIVQLGLVCCLLFRELGPAAVAPWFMRVNKLKTASKSRSVIISAAIIVNLLLCILPMVTFIFASRRLDITAIFTVISCILFLEAPLSMPLQMMLAIITSSMCLERIQNFLYTESRVDFRVLSLDPFGDVSENNPSDNSNSAHTTGLATTISDGGFGWEIGKASLSRIDLQIPMA
ncbi:hypothetical protein BKA67DRAFT_595718 [Truncatella angustata]|uniref:Uncharacterized protein n=1 Tax=Truncatella angustata TaxID=152316 RepID=A0A9P8RFZ3_9PEZI|nr:uncharacterized protein BKA67DRAFT_595718 [Truncatella angustata]KAH6645308.1 hypothetical protein BKA67DRAFT_595718 [Truncatella angustata]